MAANRTVGAFDKLRRLEEQKQREAAQRAAQQMEEERTARLTRRKRRANSRPINVDDSEDEERSRTTVKQETNDDDDEARNVIVIKDESDEEDIKPVIEPPRTPPPRAQRRQRDDAHEAGPQDILQHAPQDTQDEAQELGNQEVNTEGGTAVPSLPPDEAESEPPPPPSREELPWPEPFERLEEVFKALNTVYSFCSARKHLATTFDTLRSSVEKLVGRELEIVHIAQLKSLLPDLISFAYVDSDALEIQLDGHKNDNARMKRAEQDEVYEEAARAVANEASTSAAAFMDTLPSVTDLQAESARSEHTRDDYVLLFEFNDGTLQGAKATARGRRSIGMRRGPKKDGKKEAPRRQLYAIPSTTSMKSECARKVI